MMRTRAASWIAIAVASLMAAAMVSTGAPAAASGPILDAATFTLHSLPGSSKVMYLDFVGFANATAGETFTAFDLDGSLPCAVGTATPSCFTATELATIKDVWTRTAEAYSAFDVDVTTQDPGTAAIYKSGAADTQYGARMILGTGDGLLATNCTGSCGGLGYTASFASSAANFDPAGVVKIPNFVNPSARNVANTAVHELGHVVGLAHSTAAETANALWAPWMTAASRSDGTGAPLHQFIPSGPQDEYAVMAGLGLVPRADEPSPVSEAGANFVANGVIAGPTDQDSFQFTVPSGAGPTTITAVAAAHTSLDIVATLYDSTMTPVGTSNPPAARVDDDTASGLDAAITMTLTPGAYTFTVAGAGQSGVYSNYGSIGTYTVTALTPPATGVSVGSGSVAEGDTGKPRTISFPVVLPAPAASTVTVQYSVEADGSGSAATACTSAATCVPGSGGDFRTRSGTLTFKPSATTGLSTTTRYVNALVYPDAADEGDETFRVVLSNPVGVALARATGVGTVLDDDPASATPQFAIGDAAILEGNQGIKVTATNNAKVWITLSQPATVPVTVQVTLTPVDATPPADFKFGSANAVFPVTKTISLSAGQWQKAVIIPVFPDVVAEGNETITLTLTNPTGGPTLGRNVGTLTILNDD